MAQRRGCRARKPRCRPGWGGGGRASEVREAGAEAGPGRAHQGGGGDSAASAPARPVATTTTTEKLGRRAGGGGGVSGPGRPGPMGGCVGSHHDSSGSLNENSDGTGGESGGGAGLCLAEAGKRGEQKQLLLTMKREAGRGPWRPPPLLSLSAVSVLGRLVRLSCLPPPEESAPLPGSGPPPPSNFPQLKGLAGTLSKRERDLQGPGAGLGPRPLT